MKILKKNIGDRVNFSWNLNITFMKTREVIIKYPLAPRAEKLIHSYGKRRQKSLLAIWYALQKCSKNQNKDGYFDVPSAYLCKVRRKYTFYIKALKDAGIIEVYGKSSIDFDREASDLQDQLIDKVTFKESYSTYLGLCKKYRFCYDRSHGHQEITMLTEETSKYWNPLIESSLKELGIAEVRMSRDNFAQRLHHNLSANVTLLQEIVNGKSNYKNHIITNYGGQYTIIDAIACQPTILNEILHIIDDEYIKAINSADFYSYLEKTLNLKSRNEAKKTFNLWAMHPGFIKSQLNQLFPKMTRKKLKMISKGNDKIVSKKLQKLESTLFIDKCLDNIEADLGISFCLTIHDSMIVRNKDVEKVKEYLEINTPFTFKLQKL